VSVDFLALKEMKKTLRPPYPPDLAPSDLFLFGYVKRNLMKYRAENLAQLLGRFQVISRAIPGELLVECFLERMKRLQRCVDLNGEFV
jgi:hypothetical protein